MKRSNERSSPESITFIICLVLSDSAHFCLVSNSVQIYPSLSDWISTRRPYLRIKSPRRLHGEHGEVRIDRVKRQHVVPSHENDTASTLPKPGWVVIRETKKRCCVAMAGH